MGHRDRLRHQRRADGVRLLRRRADRRGLHADRHRGRGQRDRGRLQQRGRRDNRDRGRDR